MQYLNGKRLQRAVVAAAQHVLECQERLNRINVFPVPDGDTGTNMAMTMKAIAEGAINAGNLSLGGMSRQLARSALMGARGNSGAILAQFFHGLAQSFQGVKRVGLTGISNSFQKAVEHAEQAVVNPVEGTILTVMRDWANHLLSTQKSDLQGWLTSGLKAAVRSLKQTPEKLPVLAQAKVVDAGAQGFVNMLEGVVRLVEHGPDEWGSGPEDAVKSAEDVVKPDANEQYRYCTECLIEGASLDLPSIREAVAPMGDSLIVAGGDNLVRVHIHVDEPAAVFDVLSAFGDVSREKYEDMFAQHQTQFTGAKHGLALITDSSCDVPTDYLIRHQIHVVPVRVSFGPRDYLDRINITGNEVYRLMGSSPYHPKTSQPSPEDFAKAYRLAGEHAEQGLALMISAALSGTYQAANLARKLMDQFDVEVFDTKNAAGAHGLLLMLAAEAIEAGCSREDVLGRLEYARPHVKLFASLETLKFAIRGGRVGRIQGFVAKLLGLVPVLSIKPDGRIAKVAVCRPKTDNGQTLLRLVADFVDGREDLRFVVCHADAWTRAEAVRKELEHRYGVTEVPVLPVSPTLGAHVGPGTVAVCVMAFPVGTRPW